MRQLKASTVKNACDRSFPRASGQHPIRGTRGGGVFLQALLSLRHGLRVELQFDRQHPDPTGLKDVILESVVTTIRDLEDAVAAVDADKVRVYRNWNGIMQGTLEAVFEKAG